MHHAYLAADAKCPHKHMLTVAGTLERVNTVAAILMVDNVTVRDEEQLRQHPPQKH
jgi:hypothetical protein